MSGYYSQKLSADRLRRCYDLAPPAVQRYLQAEIEYVRQKISAGDRLLELGCGYGRVLRELASPEPELMVGIDTSLPSLRLAQEYLSGLANISLAQMDAILPAFRPHTFDLVFCIQNGISAFHVDERRLITSAVRMAKRGGRILFSSYAEEFWENRLEWFRIQASYGLIGEVDETATGKGVIVCKDGFTASTLSPMDFLELSKGLAKHATVKTVAHSALFCEILSS